MVCEWRGWTNCAGQFSPFTMWVLGMDLGFFLPSKMSPEDQIFLNFLLSQHCVLSVVPVVQQFRIILGTS